MTQKFQDNVANNSKDPGRLALEAAFLDARMPLANRIVMQLPPVGERRKLSDMSGDEILQQMSLSEHKELTDYYARMQRSPGFVENKLLCPKMDFLQPWLASDWRYEDYKSYLEKIKALGMEYVVLQYVAKVEVDSSSVRSEFADNVFTSQVDVVDNLLLAAKEVLFSDHF